MKNEIKRLEEIGLGELRGKVFTSRIEMFEAIRRCNSGITIDRRTSDLWIDNKRYCLVSKKESKNFMIDYIFNSYEIEVEENGKIHLESKIIFYE